MPNNAPVAIRFSIKYPIRINYHRPSKHLGILNLARSNFVLRQIQIKKLNPMTNIKLRQYSPNSIR